MEFGEMKRNTLNWSNFCILLRRAGLSASAGLSCFSKIQSPDHCLHSVLPEEKTSGLALCCVSLCSSLAACVL